MAERKRDRTRGARRVTTTTTTPKTTTTTTTLPRTLGQIRPFMRRGPGAMLEAIGIPGAPGTRGVTSKPKRGKKKKK